MGLAIHTEAFYKRGSMNEKELLESLIPAITGIDGECPVCIENFCRRTNLILEANQLPYRYEFKLGWDDDERVRLLTLYKR